MSKSTAFNQTGPVVLDAPTSALGQLRFDNRFVRDLPADPRQGPAIRQVHRAFHSRVEPVRTPTPLVVAWSPELSNELGLDHELWATEEAALVFTGNALLAGSEPHAANYGGHQFGTWAGQLGDGRAIALGEVVDRDGNHQTLQLKGAGPTPYSRRADGLAVLRSSIREFLCSEAMHHLGVPTTRALSLALTGNQVVRDILYDGNPAPEPGAVVCRVAPSFLRFGNYQLPASRGEVDELRQLAEFTVRHYFAHLPGAEQPTPATYAEWFDEVCRASSDLVVDWMRVGFVHGVMNTDNMSIHGLTIDYGPYGWLDDFDQDWTPNTTDAAGRRYRFGSQPQVTQWNLLQLANALVPLIEETEPLEASLSAFATRFRNDYRIMMLSKLGLEAGDPGEDDAMVGSLLDLLQGTEIDMTIFYRRLASLPLATAGSKPENEGDELATEALAPDRLGGAYYDLEGVPVEARNELDRWLRRYRDRLRATGLSDGARSEAMNRVNPKYVLRNYLAQLAIDAAQAGDFSLVHDLAAVLRRPYDEQPEAEAHAARRPDWARNRPGCSMLSCSS